MDTKVLIASVDYEDIDIVNKDGTKRRISGTGSFPAPLKKDIGRVVVVTRPCISWDGCLGYFEDDKKQVKYAFSDHELAERVEVVSMDDFGKDHWSMLGYVNALCVDGMGAVGRIDNRKCRCNPERHSEKDHMREAWNPEYGTRLKGYWGKNDKVNKKKRIDWHDDWDCLSDLATAGLVIIKDYDEGEVVLTEKGMDVAGQLSKHKAKGGCFANFEVNA